MVCWCKVPGSRVGNLCPVGAVVILIYSQRLTFSSLRIRAK